MAIIQLAITILYLIFEFVIYVTKQLFIPETGFALNILGFITLIFTLKKIKFTTLSALSLTTFLLGSGIFVLDKMGYKVLHAETVFAFIGFSLFINEWLKYKENIPTEKILRKIPSNNNSEVGITTQQSQNISIYNKRYKSKRSSKNERRWQELRFLAFKKYGKKCACCGVTEGEFHVDHIKPKSKYPHLEYEFENLQILCRDCNMGKSNKHEDDFRTEKKTS